MNILNELKNPPKKYRSVPFWSWNEKLEPEETRRQVRIMNEAGIGGFFMHARGGLQTEYMSDEWFENVSAAIDEGNKCGMYSWAYDENGWPSGFGGGKVNGLGVKYQQKYLRMEDKPEHTDTRICACGDHWFYYDINPFYVDTLDREVIKEFIECTYKPYYEKYKNEITGFFTDEPQISRNGIPWSFVFEDEYKNRYGEDIKEHLHELFLPVGDYKKTRIKFWKMVTDLFSDAFMKQIYDWCDERNLKLTGHLVLEERFRMQISSNGACMPHYEYFHIPGMDWLGRNLDNGLIELQLSSVAQQLGKKQVLAETFALCGHNVSLTELKGMYEWQMVRGVNLLCQHLEGYSLRGIRKRDYPPAMYYQQPWWTEYGKMLDALTRESMLLTEGRAEAKILLMHPQTTVWTKYDGTGDFAPEPVNDEFVKIIELLESKHVQFHLGDETIMERHAKIENGKIIIGSQTYDKVIIGCCEYFLPYTEKLLEEYKNSGGTIVTAEEIEGANVCDNKEITYTKRYYDGFTVHFFTNTSAVRKDANINIQGKKLNIYSGELEAFGGSHSFEPWGSLMIIEDGSKNISEAKEEINEINLDGKFRLAGKVTNTMTLNRCDYWFDGELQEKNGYVLNICERANALAKKVSLKQEYHINVEKIPETLELVCETPEKFIIKINGVILEEKPSGYFADKSFEKIDIQKYIKCGDNVISFECDLVQSDEFYQNLKNAYIFESEKNKLVYDMEIEAIYLIGDFSVKTDGKWTDLERYADRYEGGFTIAELPEEITLTNIQRQGFPFFCGELEFEGEVDISQKNAVLNLAMTGVNAMRIELGGETKTIITDNRLPLTGMSGKKKIRLTLINNLRNLLGPHHLKEGESYSVHPGLFFKEACIWKKGTWDDGGWDDNYCFTKMGIKSNI